MIRLRCALLMVSAACSVVFGAVDPGLVALIPSDTQTVLNINAQEARSSEFGRYLLRDIRWNDTKIENLIAATGFDPRRDLVTLLVASSDTSQGSEMKQHGSFIALSARQFQSPEDRGGCVAARSDKGNGGWPRHVPDRKRKKRQQGF